MLSEAPVPEWLRLLWFMFLKGPPFDPAETHFFSSTQWAPRRAEAPRSGPSGKREPRASGRGLGWKTPAVRAGARNIIPRNKFLELPHANPPKNSHTIERMLHAVVLRKIR
ncbi:hypothetical protein DFH06DRAFT_1128122 [Mycena polygramma]|nr:hypothetical protein DFH06DRAFT_1128122 [Mycena polygramma]